jgi:type I restriction enzyme S subunit
MDIATQLLTEHLDTWTATVHTKTSAGRGGGKKRELYGIKKLRELILELAVRGLLVPQDPNDEPASELLKQIKKEKAQRLEEGEIKKTKKLPPIKQTELPYQLPTGWSWVRFGDISIIERGGSPRPIKSYITESAEGLNWIKIGDTDQGGKYIRSTAEKITTDGLKKTRRVYPGDFLLTNSMSFGRPYITLIEGCIHDGWLRISPPKSLDKDFLYNLLSSPFVHRSFKASASGAVVQNLNSEKVRTLPISLPPLAEQQRIVAKVDELMGLCDRLEQQQSDHMATHELLVKTLLDALVAAASDAEQWTAAWQRIAAHFDALFTTEASIDQLKQTILQLAVMGKLVEQDPNDEPASELLKASSASKEQLAGERKIRKDKEQYSPSIGFEVPNSWEWACIGEFSHVLGGKRVPRGYSLLDTPTDHVYIRVTDMKEGTVLLHDLKYIDDDIYKQIKKYIINSEDVYVTIAGTIGATGKIPTALDGMNLTENASKLVFRDINQGFLILTLSSSYVQQQFDQAVNQMAQPKLSLTSIKHTNIAVPPLAEQHRIVAKVDELMALCDALKAKLQAAQATQLQLTDSLVEQAVG